MWTWIDPPKVDQDSWARMPWPAQDVCDHRPPLRARAVVTDGALRFAGDERGGLRHDPYLRRRHRHGDQPRFRPFRPGSRTSSGPTTSRLATRRTFPTTTQRPCTPPGGGRKQEKFTLVEGSGFGTEPSGTCARKAYEHMRDTLLAEMKAAMPLDGVLLGMHGAFVAEGYDDVEGDILEKARKIVGDKCVIGVELDPHCHLTKKRVSLADIIILYKEYPHTDFMPRAEEAAHDRADGRSAARSGRAEPLRLPHDRLLPDHDGADPLLRRPHVGAGGTGRRALRLARPRLPPRASAGDGHPRAGLHGQRQEGRRRAGDAAWAGDRVAARQDVAEAAQRRQRAESRRRHRRKQGSGG